MLVEREVLLSGLRFPEGARWHGGHLWFSDMFAGKVFRLDVGSGAVEEVVSIEDRVSGLGWLPDGSLLVSCMLSRTVRRLADDGRFEVFADLSGLTPWPINDLVTDHAGRTYIGVFGFDYYSGAPALASDLYCIDPHGTVRTAAAALDFPNGSVILPGTSTLVVAETWGGRLTAFEIGENGELTDRRTWATVPEGSAPDGICVDAERAVWVSCIGTGEFVRVDPGGAVTDRIDVGDRCAIDCVLGGEDGRTLFLLTSAREDPMQSETGTGQIEAVRVAVPGPAEART